MISFLVDVATLGVAYSLVPLRSIGIERETVD